jgi:2-methylcitrate dehydratase PrpD
MQHAAAQHLGHFIATSRWDNVPEPVRVEGKRSLLNFIGCAIGSTRSEPVQTALSVLMAVSGAERVTLPGRSERLDILSAAFINAIAGNLLDYDDTHLRTVIHPAAPVAPAALALAEQHRLSGQALLHAFIIGMETECRIGNAVSPGHYARGWHITATCGVFGAAACGAKLLALTAEQTAHALGIAASQSAGVVENLPSSAKNVGVGNAARNGLFAALLAQQGYTAAPASIEGTFGWARAMGDTAVTENITDGLGVRWEVLGNTYKPYPCGIVMHAVIDACLRLRREHALNASEIADVTVSGDQLLLDRGDRAVSGERDARVSIHHCAAVALMFGAAGLHEFSEPLVHDPAVTELRARTKAVLDPSSPRGAATATVRTTDGRTLSAQVVHPKGSTEDPLSDQELAAKLRDLAAYGGFGGAADHIVEAVWQLDAVASADALLRSLRPPQ